LHAIAEALLREETLEGGRVRDIIRRNSEHHFGRSSEQKHAHFL